MKFSAHDMLADSWSNLHRLVIVSNQLPYFGRPLLLLKRRIDVAQLAELIALELAFQVMSRADSLQRSHRFPSDDHCPSALRAECVSAQVVVPRATHHSTHDAFTPHRSAKRSHHAPRDGQSHSSFEE